MVKRPPAMQETRVWSLGWEYPLEREVATHSSILAWEIPWTEEHGSYSSWGLKSWTQQLSMRPFKKVNQRVPSKSVSRVSKPSC